MLAHDVSDCPKCRLLALVYDPSADAERFARCHDELTDATATAVAVLERRWRAARREGTRRMPASRPTFETVNGTGP
ncbi:MAG: hypothetical protein ACRDWE_14000 [Acidimicrobiales bacterium]